MDLGNVHAWTRPLSWAVFGACLVGAILVLIVPVAAIAH